MTTTPNSSGATVNAQSLSWKIGGMDCASCAATIRGAVERLPGVSDVKLSVMSETMTLALDESRTDRAAIEKRVAGLGYTTVALAAKAVLPSTPAKAEQDGCGCSGHDHSHHDHSHHDHGHHGHDDAHDGHDHAPAASAKAAADSGHGTPGHVHEAPPDGMSWYQTGKGRLVLVTGACLAAAWSASLAWPAAAHWAFIAACLIGVIPVARKAFAAASAGMPFTIEMLMTIAATGALFIGAALSPVAQLLTASMGDSTDGSIMAGLYIYLPMRYLLCRVAGLTRISLVLWIACSTAFFVLG